MAPISAVRAAWPDLEDLATPEGLAGLVDRPDREGLAGLAASSYDGECAVTFRQMSCPGRMRMKH